MKFKMYWDATVECGDHLEVRMGIHIICAEDEKDAVQRALAFLHNGAFVDWDAFIENDTFFEDLDDYR
jgi:hypothetical protein